MSKQSFERLIRLEDEELMATTGADPNEDLSADEPNSYKIPMLNNNNSNIEQRHKPTKTNSGGFHFTVNGRHIQVNTEQLKYLSLVTLTVQNAALNLSMRAANTQEVKFSKSAAVTVAEILKLFTCLLLVCYEEMSIKGAIRSVKTNIVDNYLDTLKVAVPSFIYYVQNNLLYIGSTHLDAATGQVTYQLKIITTAIFSVTMLNKKLTRLQWISLIILFTGVALIQTITVSTHNSLDTSVRNQTRNLPKKDEQGENPLLGFLAILIASGLSGFAGVYFEKILKNTSQVSLWIRNIQLAAVAIPIGLIQTLAFEESDGGLFHGFTGLTWLCIILQVQGGLLVAVVVKFANNILKGFATSLAIIISTVASIFLFQFDLSLNFILGASLVISSVLMYSK